MADSRWMITIDGKQQDGDYSVDETRDLIKKNSGKHLLVWAQGMAQWADPNTVPEFRKMPGKQHDTEKELRPKISSEELKEKAGLIKGLLDFRFQNLVTSKIIPILYVISLLLILLGGLFYFLVFGGGSILTGIKTRSALPVIIGIGVMILTPILMLLYLAMIRIWCESVIVFFRMKEDVEKLASKSSLTAETEKK